MESGTRPDGRTPEDPRPTKLILGPIGTCHGSACMKIGETSVVCGIKADVVRAPVSTSGSSGTLSCQVHFPVLCSPRFKASSNQQPELSYVVQQHVMGLLDSPRLRNLPGIESSVFDLSDLSIAGSKWTWSLQADVICTSYDGNAVDACIGAFVGALKNLRLPEATYDGDLDKVNLGQDLSEGISLKSYPVSTTFAVLDGTLLVDPTDLEEEALSSGSITVITNGKDVLKVAKSGGVVISPAQLDEMITLAQKRHRQVVELLDEPGEGIDK